MFLHVLGDVDGLAKTDEYGGTVTEIVAVVETRRDNIYRLLVPELAVGLHRYVEDSFAELAQGVFGAVRRLRIKV